MGCPVQYGRLHGLRKSFISVAPTSAPTPSWATERFASMRQRQNCRMDTGATYWLEFAPVNGSLVRH